VPAASHQIGDVPGADTGAVIGDQASPRERARIHTSWPVVLPARQSRRRALRGAHRVAADSNYAPAYNLLGLVYGDLRETGLAEDAFQRSLSLNPNDPDANHNYAWFLCENKREQESLRYFLLAVRYSAVHDAKKVLHHGGELRAARGERKGRLRITSERALKARP